MSTASSANHQWTGSADFSNASAFYPKSQSITDAALVDGQASKSGRHEHAECFGLAYDDTPATSPNDKPLCFIARAAGTLETFYAGLETVGTSEIEVNLMKNGTSVLSGGTAVSVVSPHTDGQNVAGTLTTTSFVAGDRIQMVLTVTTAGTGAGPFGVVHYKYSAEPT